MPTIVQSSLSGQGKKFISEKEEKRLRDSTKGIRAVFRIVVFVTACSYLSGCALIALPFKILGETLKLIDKLPKPPPGVF